MNEDNSKDRLIEESRSSTSNDLTNKKELYLGSPENTHKILMPVRDRRVKEAEDLPEYEDNKDFQQCRLWDLYSKHSQTTLTNDESAITSIIQALIGTISTYEQQQNTRLNNLLLFKNKRSKQGNQLATHERIVNKYAKMAKKRRYSFSLSSSESTSPLSQNEELITHNDQEIPENRTNKKRKLNSNYGKFPKHSSKQEENSDPTFTLIKYSSKKLQRRQNIQLTNVRRSGRVAQKIAGKTYTLDTSDDEMPEKKERQREDAKLDDKKSSNNQTRKMVDGIKKKQLQSRAETEIKMSNLKQRMNASETMIDDEIKKSYKSTEQFKEKLMLEQAKIKTGISMTTKEREIAQKEKEDLRNLNTQLQTENNRLRKINVHLQNTVVLLDRKLREKIEIFEQLGLDADEVFQRYNPYSATPKLDTRKTRQRILFNCADAIGAGTIEDGVQLISDLHNDLQEHINNRHINRGHSVLAESYKIKRTDKALESSSKKKTTKPTSIPDKPSTIHLNSQSINSVTSTQTTSTETSTLQTNTSKSPAQKKNGSTSQSNNYS